MKARPSIRLPRGGDGKQRRGRVIAPSMSRCSCRKLGSAALAAKETGEPIHAYRCTEGHCWHIGHPIGLNGRPTIPEPEETQP